MSGFERDDYEHTAKLLRSGDDKIVRATLSNNFNIILAALDKCSGTINRPDWFKVLGETSGARPDDNELTEVTRGTLRHAAGALRTMNADDYYHNNGAAEHEIIDVLAVKATVTSGELQK